MMLRFVGLLALSSFAVASAAVPRASSEFRDSEGERFPAANAFDGLITTAWIQAPDDEAEQPWVEIRLDRTTDVQSVSVWVGDLSRGTRSLREGPRPRTLTVTLMGGDEEVVATRRLPDQALDRPSRVDVPIEGSARTIRVQVDDVYDGVVRSQVALAEVAINHTANDEEMAAPGSTRLREWMDSAAGARAAERDAEAVAELVATMASEEDFEAAREARAELMDRAANGAPYVRERAARSVPQGFRTRAIAPQDDALAALYDALDPGVIPALEAAALRSVDAEERQLWANVEKYQAYAELRGGQRSNVPAWGESGWSRGQLQSFEEPLQLEVDQFGLVYVADSANNRVQRFNERGSADGQYGAPEPGVTNAWIGGPRRYYAAGSEAGVGPGVFTTPLDVTILPGKDGDGFAAIDGEGQVQVYNAEGTVTGTWRVPSNGRVRARMGGQVYLEHSKGKLVAIWGDQGFVYKLDGEEVGRFELEDGVPSGAMVLKNGKLGLIYQQELVMYSLDGFRHGTILSESLDEGFESWDVAMAEDKTIWAVTDTGWLYQFKKPGKLLFSWRFTEDPIVNPRIDVHNGRVYLTQANHIRVIDALEEMARREAEAE